MHVQPESLIVLDEVQKVFGSREWASAKNNAFASWASTHRHNGFDVVLISQAVERIDSAVRSLLEWTYVFRKVNFFGGAIQRKYLCSSYGGGDTNGSPLKKSVRTYNAKVFLCYKSYVASDVKELGIMQHVNVLKHPVFFAIPIVLFFTLYMLFAKSSLGTGDLFGSKQAMAAYEQRKGKQPVSSTSKSPPLPPGSIRSCPWIAAAKSFSPTGKRRPHESLPLVSLLCLHAPGWGVGLWSVRLLFRTVKRASTSGQSASKNRSGQACGKSSASGGQERRSGFG